MRWLLISLVIFILGIFNFFAPVRGSLQYVINPLQFGLQEIATGIKSGANFYLRLREIHSSNLDLLESNAVLMSEVSRLKELEEENQLLRDQVGVIVTTDLSKGLILAQTLGNFQDRTGTSISLDRGSLHGISVGDIVIKGQHLVGVVRGVTSQRSDVELVTSPSLSMSVQDLDTKTEGLISGEFGTAMLMTRILPGELIAIGDTVVTSGRDGLFFPGFIVGEVTEVSAESSEILKYASVKAILDLENLGKVFVIPFN